MSKTLTCPVCGAAFEKRRHNQVCCSPKCQATRSRMRDRESERRRRRRLGLADDYISASKPVTFEVLSKAKTKPANTSAVRWRMELRRRAMQRQFGPKNLTMLPDPNLLY